MKERHRDREVGRKKENLKERDGGREKKTRENENESDFKKCIWEIRPMHQSLAFKILPLDQS